MAVQAVKSATRVVLSIQTGVDLKGNAVKKAMNLSKIKGNASDDSIFATAKAMEPLLKYPVVGIGKEDTYNLSEA